MRIKFGKETRADYGGHSPRDVCHDCKCRGGQFHFRGCDIEECSKCKLQIITCACSHCRMDKLEVVRLLKINARQFYSCALGAKTPFLDKIKELMHNPKPGDLVVEITALYRDLDSLESIGRLVAIEQWPCGTPEEYECEPDKVPTKKVYTLELVFDNNRKFTWENAQFIRVFEREIMSIDLFP